MFDLKPLGRQITKTEYFCIVNRPIPKFSVCFPVENLLTLSQTANLRLSQTERVCRQQFRIDENGRKFPKKVQNIVDKREIARDEQFLLFPQCFQKTCTADS